MDLLMLESSRALEERQVETFYAVMFASVLLLSSRVEANALSFRRGRFTNLFDYSYAIFVLKAVVASSQLSSVSVLLAFVGNAALSLSTTFSSMPCIS